MTTPNRSPLARRRPASKLATFFAGLWCRADRMTGVLVGIFGAVSGPVVPAATLPPGFTITEIATGLDPTRLEIAPDGRVFVLEKVGRVRIIENDVLLPAPFLTFGTDVPYAVDNFNERGLCGLAFDPDFASNGHIYLYFTMLTPGPTPTDTFCRIIRVTANGNTVVPASDVVIFDLDNVGTGGTGHLSGGMFFLDGKLMVTAGEAFNGPNAQDLGNALGKVLRLNPDGSIPTDNPFYATATGKGRAIYALGLRNPFGFGVEPGTGRVFVNDVGGHSNSFEEINHILAGGNYGWPDVQGFANGAPTPANYHDPEYAYPAGGHNGGYAVTAGCFYTPTTVEPGRFPQSYDGLYFFGDYVNFWLKTLDPDTGTVADFLADGDRPLTVRVTDGGIMYLLTRGSVVDGSTGDNTSSNDGRVHVIRYTGSTAASISSHPQPVLQSVGLPASFSTSVSGAPPFEYRWQRNEVDLADGLFVSNSTTSTYTVPAVALADDGALYRCVVTNSGGSATTNAALLSVTTRPPPEVTMTSPAHQSLFVAGVAVSYAGSAMDDEDGPLPTSALTWAIDFHHGTHTHPFLPPTSGVTGGAFTPSTSPHGTDIWYRVYLTATNSIGLKTTVFHEVLPTTSLLTLATNPTGLDFKLDSQIFSGPLPFNDVVGFAHQLEVVSPQLAGGRVWTFDSWSDGGAAAHVLTTPAADTTVTAWYTEQPLTGAIREYWLGISGAEVADLTNDPAFGNAPDGFEILPTLAGPVDWDDNYGARLSGQLMPAASGDYQFRITSDDTSELWLSSDAAPANKVLIAAVTTTAPSAYDSFDYATGSLAGNGSPGTGWAGAWSGANTVAADSLDYTDGNGAAHPTSGNHVQAGGNVESFRSLATTYASGTVWLSFIAKGSPDGVGYGGVSLFMGATERLFIGELWMQGLWGLERAGGTNVFSAVASAAQTFFVVRIDLGAVNANVWLWLNPDLGAGAEPSIATADAQLPGFPVFDFDRVRLAAGDGATLQLDELRLGSAYADVAPDSNGVFDTSAVVALVAGTRYYVEVLHKAGVGTDNVTVAWAGPLSGGGDPVFSPIPNAQLPGLEPLAFPPFETWRRTHFPGAMAVEALSGFTADFDGDGMLNGIEYALDLDPLTPDANLSPQGELVDGSLCLTYARDLSLTDITYIAETSPDLSPGSWTTAGVTETVLATNGTVQTVRACVALGSATRAFLRLRVDLD